MPAGTGYSGSDGLPRFSVQAAAPRDLDGVVQRLGQVGEQLRHLLRACAGTACACSAAAAPDRPAALPSWMQTRASCASKSRGVEEAHVVGGDHRHAVPAAAPATAATVSSSSPGRPGALQLEVIAVAEQVAASASSAPSASLLAAVWPAARGRRRPARAPDSAISPRVVAVVSQRALRPAGPLRCWPSR